MVSLLKDKILKAEEELKITIYLDNLLDNISPLKVALLIDSNRSVNISCLLCIAVLFRNYKRG